MSVYNPTDANQVNINIREDKPKSERGCFGSCLASAWEGIKSFFSMLGSALFYIATCGGCRSTKKNSEEPASLQDKKVVIVKIDPPAAHNPAVQPKAVDKPDQNQPPRVVVQPFIVPDAQQPPKPDVKPPIVPDALNVPPLQIAQLNGAQRTQISGADYFDGNMEDIMAIIAAQEANGPIVQQVAPPPVQQVVVNQAPLINNPQPAPPPVAANANIQEAKPKVEPKVEEKKGEKTVQDYLPELDDEVPEINVDDDEEEDEIKIEENLEPQIPLNQKPASKFKDVEINFQLDEQSNPYKQIQQAKDKFLKDLKESAILSTAAYQDTKELLAYVDFAKEKIDLFNKSIKPAVEKTNLKKIKGFKDIELLSVDAADFIYKLTKAASTLDELLKVFNGPSINKETLNKLSLLAQNPVKCSEFPKVRSDMEHLIRAIAAKPVHHEILQEKRYAAVFYQLADSFNIEGQTFAPKTFAEVMDQSSKEYQDSLEIRLIAQISHVKKLTPKDIRDMIGTFRKEWNKFPDMMKVMYEEAKDYKFMEAHELFKDLETLVATWDKMAALSSNIDLEKKMVMLEAIARDLPENHAIYDRYQIKDAMEASLIPLGFTYFASHKVDFRSEYNKKLVVRVNTAFQEMARKLGCKNPPSVQVDMDTSEDEEKAAQETYKLAAIELTHEYFAALRQHQQDETMAASAVIYGLNQQVSIFSYDKQALARKGIIENLPLEIRRKVQNAH